MQKVVTFEVPSQVLGDFIQEIVDRGMIATASATNDREVLMITVPYEKEQEDEIDELNEYLQDLISDIESDVREEDQ